MVTIRTSAHIRTNRHRHGLHDCPTSTGVPMWRVEAARQHQAWFSLIVREGRRGWLEEGWRARLARRRGRKGGSA